MHRDLYVLFECQVFVTCELQISAFNVFHPCCKINIVSNTCVLLY